MGGRTRSEGGFDAGSATQGAEKGFRGALGVGFDGKAHFGEGGLKFPLPQQENCRIARTPRRKGGKPFGVQKGVTRSNQIGFRFRKRRQDPAKISEDAGFNDRAET